MAGVAAEQLQREAVAAEGPAAEVAVAEEEEEVGGAGVESTTLPLPWSPSSLQLHLLLLLPLLVPRLPRCSRFRSRLIPTSGLFQVCVDWEKEIELERRRRRNSIEPFPLTSNIQIAPRSCGSPSFPRRISDSY